VPKTDNKSFTKLEVNDFVHLHNHTQYSLLDGLTKVPALMEKTNAFGMDAIAMTDHGTLSGAIEFYAAAKNAEIKPIIGIEAYVAPRKHTDKDPAFDKNYFHLIILAMNNVGYKNLMKLSTTANLDGFYYKPRVDHDLIEKYNEGLIVLSGCINGEVGDALRQGQYDQAKKTAEWYKSVFKDRYYIEIQDHGHPEHPSSWADQISVNEQAFKLAEELNLPTVITGDAHYLEKDDQEAHEILLCVQTGSFLSDESRMSLKDFELHVADPKEVIERWGSEHPESIANTKKIAERCDLELELGKYLIPSFPTPKGETEKSYLELLTYQGLMQRYEPNKKPAKKISELKKQLPKHIVERAEYELGVISGMNFNGYFLIVQDFINWGKDKGIVFGPGRGSGAGSIVAYGLRITELDPLEYDLLFERFLNPDRISMPDFDIDIQDSRRDEVIKYCVEKYGSDRVANIVTFGRMAARNAVRDVARVLQVPYAEADRLAKMIPPPIQGRHIPLAKSLKDNSDLKAEYRNNETAQKVFDLAVKLEGTIRSHGVHAAGVVIAPDDIVKFAPLEMAQKGVVSTQYSMGPIEDIGLLKMDFLGLSNLTIIKNALRIIDKAYGKSIDIDSIPLADEKTFELFQRGDTTGVFQLESSGMKRYLKELQPTVFDDIIAMVALYRPGPMQWIGDFIARKHGKKKIEYLHPKMEASLSNTYGVIVYQEQVMQISIELCGFSGGQADTLRKAIGKKIPEVLAKLKTDFIEGAIKTSNADRKIMDKFWKQLEEFAAYCFNKAHAACYGMIAYQTAYLKAHFPAAFMAALMTSDYDNTDRLAIEIAECKANCIDVLPPDVNKSFHEFAVIKDEHGDHIRFGMDAIKNVGKGAVEEIINAREDGEFTSLEDFLSRVSGGAVNRKTLESLAKSGALDSFGDRSLIVNNLDNLVAFSSRLQKQSNSGQVDLFGGQEHDLGLSAKLQLNTTREDFPEKEQLAWERELLGIYLSKHPLGDYEDILALKATPIQSLDENMHDKRVVVGGSVTEKREIVTKNGQKMAFIKFADLSGDIELILFPGTYQQVADLWQHDNVLLVSGKVTSKDRMGNGSEVKIIVDSAEELQPTSDQSSTKSALEARVYVRMSDTNNEKALARLKSMIDDRPGTVPVVLVVGDDNQKQAIKIPSLVTPDEEFISSLSEIFGAEHVKYQ
jgi:DNA polymerase III subunit alpha